MCNVSDPTRPNSGSQAPSDAGNTRDPYERTDPYEELIEKANTVPLAKIFSHYNIYCNSANHTIRCPFKSHSNGHESTGSFNFYSQTNSFHCFGCKKGGPFAHAVHFVSFMEGVSKEVAAYKVIEIFGSTIAGVPQNIIAPADFDERLDIMLDLSNAVRQFRQDNSNSENSSMYIESACKRFDQVYSNLDKENKVNNIALKRIVGQLKEYIRVYK